jgi:hypothetical protein
MLDVSVPDLGAPDGEALLLVQQVAGPSLSTPQKRKPRPAVDDEKIGETTNGESDDAAIYRQLHSDANSDGMDEFEDDLGLDSEPVDQLVFPDDTSGVETPSRPTSLAPPPLKETQPVASAPTPIQPSFPSSAPAAPTPPSQTTPASARIHPAWANAFSQQSQTKKPLKPQSQNGHATQNGKPWSFLTKPQQPKPPASTTTPGSGFKAAGPSNGTNSVLGSDSPAAKRKGQPTGKGSSHERQQAKKQKLTQKDEPAADEWEVKDLLDDRWVTERGAKVHMYLVLWAGDWSEDQNPTWEPAENVQDQGLINRYQKKKKAGLLKPSQKRQKTLHRYLYGAKYSSVTEAFEDGIDDQTGLATGVESDTDLPDETFCVTDNVGDVTANRMQAAPMSSFGSFDTLLAQYNQSFPRR